MAYDEALAARVKAALKGTRGVQQKKMFGGLAFMVKGKMCVTVGRDRIMCRIDPAIHDEALQHKDSRTVVMRGHEFRGYVYVNADAISKKTDLDYWVALALAFNTRAKASSPKRKRTTAGGI